MFHTLGEVMFHTLGEVMFHTLGEVMFHTLGDVSHQAEGVMPPAVPHNPLSTHPITASTPTPEENKNSL
jgi:hypothetical protein